MQAAAYGRTKEAGISPLTGGPLGCHGRDAVGGDSRGISQHKGSLRHPGLWPETALKDGRSRVVARVSEA
jgi:hypothetical protein